MTYFGRYCKFMELHFIKVHLMLILLTQLHFCYYTVVAMLVQVQFLFFKFFAVVVVALIKVPDVDSAT